jgi:hypothetical protein
MAKKTISLEVAEEDILYYIEDQHGKEIGFAVLEDGVEHEYFYAKKAAAAAEKAKEASVMNKALNGEAVVSRESVSDFAKELNTIHRENSDTISTIKEAGSAIKDGLDFLKDPLGLKKPRKPETDATSLAAQPATPATAAGNNITVNVMVSGNEDSAGVQAAVEGAIAAANSAQAAAPAQAASPAQEAGNE